MLQPKIVTAISAAAPIQRRLAPWQLERALTLLREHLDSGIDVTTLAAACCLSRSDFSRKFKASTGHSPQAWLRVQRVEKAKRLLAEARLPLAEIGLECGFCDQAHFCRIFGRLEGITPQSWRRLAS